MIDVCFSPLPVNGEFVGRNPVWQHLRISQLLRGVSTKQSTASDFEPPKDHPFSTRRQLISLRRNFPLAKNRPTRVYYSRQGCRLPGRWSLPSQAYHKSSSRQRTGTFGDRACAGELPICVSPIRRIQMRTALGFPDTSPSGHWAVLFTHLDIWLTGSRAVNGPGVQKGRSELFQPHRRRLNLLQIARIPA